MVHVRNNNSTCCWSMKCEVRVMEVKNMILKHPSELFVRCYLSKNVPINTQKISSHSNKLQWNECFSLECLSDNKLIDTLSQEKAVFELRRKSRTMSVFKTGSSLIGKAEVEWKTVFESSDMKMVQWLPLLLKSDFVTQGVKPPKIKVEMSIEAAATMKDRRLRNIDECGCKDGGCCCRNENDELLLVLGGSMFEV